MRPVGVAAWSMLTPLGDAEETIEALFERRSGLAVVPAPCRLRNDHAAVIRGRPDHAAESGAWQRHLATRVTREVLEVVAIDHRALGSRCVFVFSTSYGHLLDDGNSDTMSTWARDCMRSIGCDLEPIVVGAGCSSSSDAIGVAAALLDCGAVDAAIVIAVDIVTPAKRMAHSALGTMATDRVKPFDVRRSGMLLGEAAAALVLVRTEHAGQRGEILGIGASNDAFGTTSPDPSGLSVKLSLARAFRAAGVTYDDIALYLAHGTGTQLNDELEARVVAELFARNEALTIVGTKGALGHSLGACGAVELILLLQMLNRRSAPPTVGMTEPIPCVRSRFANDGGHALRSPYGVSVTLGFGGFNTAIVARASRSGGW